MVPHLLTDLDRGAMQRSLARQTAHGIDLADADPVPLAGAAEVVEVADQLDAGPARGPERAAGAAGIVSAAGVVGAEVAAGRAARDAALVLRLTGAAVGDDRGAARHETVEHRHCAGPRDHRHALE